jgi:hypothetical protein
MACGGAVTDGAIPGDPGGPSQSDGPAQVPPVKGPPPPVEAREHDPRFVGLWIVEQPYHALYESTFYRFDADGTLHTGSSDPSDCVGHLARHCVTGSVANCRPKRDEGHCTGTLTCVFGREWFSKNGMLGIVGNCSDLNPRTIWIHFGKDASLNTVPGGSGGFLHSVEGSIEWSHDNWDWAFRKCPAGTTEATCR